MQTVTSKKGLKENSKIKGELLISIYNTENEIGNRLEKQIEDTLEKLHQLKNIKPQKNSLFKKIIKFILRKKEKSINELAIEYRAKYLELVQKLKKTCLVREYKVTNLITTVGRATIAQRLANDTTYTGIINYGALGSNATAVDDADTTLGTEVFRKVVASASDTDNVAFIDFFYSKADTNGTYEEFGTFIDGTGSADTGQMFTHALTGGWVKTASESMTVAVTYTIS